MVFIVASNLLFILLRNHKPAVKEITCVYVMKDLPGGEGLIRRKPPPFTGTPKTFILEAPFPA